MNFSISFNQDINPDRYNPTHNDNYFTMSNIFTFNLNEQKLDEGNFFNDYYILSKFPAPDESIFNNTYNEKLNQLNKKDNKTINNSYSQNIKSNKVSQSMSTTKLEIEKSMKNNYKNRKIGVKRKSNNSNIHDKYSDDNIMRKIKNLVLNYTLKFLNSKIKDIYKGNIGNGIIKKELVPLNHSVKCDTTIEFNRKFINKTLKEIFSENISSRFKYYLPNRNDIIINRLLKDKDEKKRLYFQRLFNLKFIQCIEAFSGANICEELKGFAQFEDIKKELDDEPQYIDKFQYYLTNFELIIKERKGRNKKQKQKNEEKEKEKEFKIIIDSKIQI